jgi:hypothetical protein
MANNKKGRNGGNRATQNTSFDSRYSTSTNPLAGGSSLANSVKPSRNRQPMRGWQRRR